MVDIQSISFEDQYNGYYATGNPFLMGAVGDLMSAIVSIGVHWESMAVTLTVDSTAKTLTRADNVSWIQAEFRIGDNITITNSTGSTINGNFTITALTDSVMTVSQAITTGVYIADVHGVTAINALDFYFNLIPNSGQLNFNSLVDNQNEQRKTCGTTSWIAGQTVSLTNATKSIGWDTSLGIDQVSKLATSNYIQNFIIFHQFQITPVYLSGQDLDGPAPYYFLNKECLKYICRVDARLSTIDPNVVHSTDPNYLFQLGNTGWFGEFLNGGLPRYTVSGLIYTDPATSATLTELDINKDVTVSFSITSIDSLFAFDAIDLHIIYCPDDITDYINTTTNYDNNFKHDSALYVVNPGMNGRYYGTDLQSIKNMTCVLVGSQWNVSFTVSYSTAIKTFLKAKSSANRKYAIWVTPQKHAASSLAETNRTACLVDFNTAAYNTNDATQLTWVRDIFFYQYPDSTTNPKTTLYGWVGDTFLVDSKIGVKVGSILNSLQIDIVVSSSGYYGEEFILSTKAFNFLGQYGTNNELCQTQYFLQPGNLKLNPNDVRGLTSFSRNVALDSLYPSIYGYSLSDSFMLRYEDWVNNPDFDKAFICSHTERWSTYSMRNGWYMLYKLSYSITDPNTGFTTTFTRTAPITIVDSSVSSNGSEHLTQTIDTFVNDGSGYVSIQGLISKDQPTHVLYSISGDFTSFPTGTSGYYAWLAIDIPNTGGESFLDKITSEADPNTGSMWMAKAVLKKVSNVLITVEADIDNTLLGPNVEQYIISGRFGYKN